MIKYKPRIRKMFGVWICNGYQPFIDNYLYSDGCTPQEAYARWSAYRRPK